VILLSEHSVVQGGHEKNAYLRCTKMSVNIGCWNYTDLFVACVQTIVVQTKLDQLRCCNSFRGWTKRGGNQSPVLVRIAGIGAGRSCSVVGVVAVAVLAVVIGTGVDGCAYGK